MQQVSVFNTFLGNIKLISEQGLLTTCQFCPNKVINTIDNSHIEIIEQLHQYFKGSLKKFDIRIHTNGTAFQEIVWQKLLTISFGKTTTYGNLAKSIGKNANPRNVGGANGANPIAIIIPCHRVIGQNGKLTGYSGGMERKRKLLELEGVLIQQSLF